VPVRNRGKLPFETRGETYELEYGEETLEIHSDAIRHGERVAIVDDVLATGGTALATAKLVESLGGNIVGMAFVIELEFLEGRKRLTDYEVLSLIRY
jgi:adenine phosphoribosyltransferase